MQRTNMDRAAEGVELCKKMEELTGVDEMRCQVSDIICTLMHTCRLIKDEDGNTMNFEDCLRGATINFEAEIEEDPDGI